MNEVAYTSAAMGAALSGGRELTTVVAAMPIMDKLWYLWIALLLGSEIALICDLTPAFDL